MLPRAEGAGGDPRRLPVARTQVVRGLLVALTACDPRIRAGTHRFGRRDFLVEPLLWLAAALALMYVLRPVAMLGYGEMILHGHSMFREASAGLSSRALRQCRASSGVRVAPPGALQIACRDRRHRSRSGPGSSRRCAMLAIAVAGSALYLLSTGQSPWSSLGGSETNSMSSTAYLYLAPYCAMPAAVILLGVGWSRRSVGSARRDRGARRVPVLLVSAQRRSPVGAAASLRARDVRAPQKRPPAEAPDRRRCRPSRVRRHHAARDLTPHSGAARSRTGRSRIRGRIPAPEWHRFATQSDTEMVAAVAAEMQIVPSAARISPGYSIVTLLARPVPHLVWEGKPRSSDQILNRDLFGALGYRDRRRRDSPTRASATSTTTRASSASSSGCS